MMGLLTKRIHGNKGFTLIEVMVVVAILGILAAVVVPKVMNAKKNAEEKAAEAELALVQSAVERYYVDTGDYPITTINGEDCVDFDDLVPNYLNKAPDTVYYIDPNDGTVST